MLNLKRHYRFFQNHILAIWLFVEKRQILGWASLRMSYYLHIRYGACLQRALTDANLLL
jgi:hypothetical protein